MTIDEAIKHCEEVAEKKEREAEYRQEAQGDMFKFFDDLSKSVGGEGVENDALNECLECAKEHRQLAEWLKELAKYREIFNKIGEILTEYGYTIDDLDTIFGKANDEEVNADYEDSDCMD